MYSPELTKTLHEVDAFHKNLFLLFEDLVQCIREKAYSETLQTAGYPEGTYGIGETNKSEFRRYHVFRHQNKVRFITMLVKTHEDYLNGGNTAYKELCRQLDRDPRFPLLLACGVLKLCGQDILDTNTYARREWTLNACFLNLQNKYEISAPGEIRLENSLTLKNTDKSSPYGGSELEVSFHDLATLTDSLKLSDMAERLLKM